MSRSLLFAAILAAGCPAVPRNIQPIQPPKARKQTACEIAMAKRPLLEKVLGKWHEKALSGVTRIYFDATPSGSAGASYNPSTRAISVSASLSLEKNIDALDHELGHSVYDRVEKMKQSAVAPILERYQELQRNNPDLAQLDRSEEVRKLNGAIPHVMISPSLSVGEWSAFLKYLQDYPPVLCIKSYLQAYYLGFPQLRSKIARLRETFSTASRLRGISVEDTLYIQSFLRQYRAFFLSFKKDSSETVPFVKKSFEATGSLCLTEVHERLDGFLARQAKAMDKLLEQRQRILSIAKTDKKTDKELADMGSFAAEMSDFLSEARSDTIPNELFARAVDSLMDVYFGPTQNDKFQLDERILSFFGKIQIGNAHIFADAVERYRKGMQMHKDGKSAEMIKKALLSGIPGRAYPRLDCTSAESWKKGKNIEK